MINYFLPTVRVRSSEDEMGGGKTCVDLMSPVLCAGLVVVAGSGVQSVGPEECSPAPPVSQDQHPSPEHRTSTMNLWQHWFWITLLSGLIIIKIF